MTNKDLSETINFLHITGKLDVKAIVINGELQLRLKVMQSPDIYFKLIVEADEQPQPTPTEDAKPARTRKTKP